MTEEMLEIISMRPFGTPMAKVVLPKDIVDFLNGCCDDNAPDYGNDLVGRIEKQPVIFSESYINKGFLKYMDYFSKAAKAFLLSTNAVKPTVTVQIKTAWMIRMMHSDEYNPMHTHNHCQISSVGFLKMPDGYKEAVEKDEFCGRLDFVGGLPSGYSHNRLNIYPEVGDFYLFPANLPHGVSPLGKLKGERRSFSVNFITKGE
jgi:hypothetical protein